MSLFPSSVNKFVQTHKSLPTKAINFKADKNPYKCYIP
jgi:hypothetical protein